MNRTLGSDDPFSACENALIAIGMHKLQLWECVWKPDCATQLLRIQFLPSHRSSDLIPLSLHCFSIPIVGLESERRFWRSPVKGTLAHWSQFAGLAALVITEGCRLAVHRCKRCSGSTCFPDPHCPGRLAAMPDPDSAPAGALSLRTAEGADQQPELPPELWDTILSLMCDSDGYLDSGRAAGSGVSGPLERSQRVAQRWVRLALVCRRWVRQGLSLAPPCRAGLFE